MKWTMPSAISGAAHGQVHIPSNEECGIRDVWKHNLEEEFRTIRKVVQKYHYVAMDTEFPGVVARPVGEFRSTADYHYQLLRCNVDLLRIIQLGLTFMDDEGKTPPGYSTWQFNFKFNLSEDMYAQDSIDLLQNSGIQFKKHEEDGIDPIEFAELLMSSGIVLVDNIKWLCFHSGYDFGYLLKLLTDQNLPADEGDFFELLHIYFPNIFDIKYLMKSCKNLKGGLQEVADQLELRRVGPQHQAGSDALLTGMAFFKMREVQHTNDLHFDLAAPIVLFPYLLEHTMHVKPSVGRVSLLTPARSANLGDAGANNNGNSSGELLTSSSFPVTPPISPATTSTGDDDSSSLGYYYRVLSDSLSNSTSDY
ncbi:CCR4-NOT transcription complex subunit 7 isoform X1 [Drosophila bipectinata]|uniref:CCR4-NOT transcription complex subunit 7 isoform X1 n=2 Tax=Drosophila bipectinata TaxID=42026 RepID=UPI0007E63FF7|nr:CCR4-NOT transcription complex subunit 7 isoform X1 [Drosophila bipectinata]